MPSIPSTNNNAANMDDNLSTSLTELLAQNLENSGKIITSLDRIHESIVGGTTGQSGDTPSTKSDAAGIVIESLKGLNKSAIIAAAGLDKLNKRMINQDGAFGKLLNGVLLFDKAWRDRMTEDANALRKHKDVYGAAVAAWTDDIAKMQRMADGAAKTWEKVTKVGSLVAMTFSKDPANKGAGKILAGMAGNAMGVMIGHPLMMLGQFLMNTVIGQMKQMWEENKKALIGGAFADSRIAAARGGYTDMYDERINFLAGDYMKYRSSMRLLGNRDDAAVANMLFEARDIINGGGGADAAHAAMSRQAVKTHLGIDVGSDLTNLLYRSTTGNGFTNLTNGQGVFTGPAAYAVGMMAVSHNSQNEFGAKASFGELNSVIQEATKVLRGNKQDWSALIGGLNKWGRAIADNTITAQELGNIYASTNQGMGFDDKLWTLAFLNKGGDYLTEAWKWNERAATASGKGVNVQEAARAALNMYRNIGGTKDSKDMMQILSNNLDHFKLGALKDNPRMLELLQLAASGNRDAQREIAARMVDESAQFEVQAKQLDAIRNPVEHIRDYLFAKGADIVSSTSKMKAAREASYRYDAITMGLTDQKDVNDYAQMMSARDDARSNDAKAAWYALKETFQRSNDHLKSIDEIKDMMKNRYAGPRESTVDTYAGGDNGQ